MLDYSTPCRYLGIAEKKYFTVFHFILFYFILFHSFHQSEHYLFARYQSIYSIYHKYPQFLHIRLSMSQFRYCNRDSLLYRTTPKPYAASPFNRAADGLVNPTRHVMVVLGGGLVHIRPLILHGGYRPRSHLPAGRGEHALHGLGLLRMRGKQTDGSTGRLSREAVADGIGG